MKKTKPTSKKTTPATIAVSVRLEGAIRKADAAKSKATKAKEALKKARKAFKLARKAAKAARKEVKALQEAFEEAISKADGKSAVSAKKTAAEFRAPAKSASNELAPSRRRPPVKHKKVRSTSTVVPASPPAEVVTSPTVVPGELKPASKTGD